VFIFFGVCGGGFHRWQGLLRHAGNSQGGLCFMEMNYIGKLIDKICASVKLQGTINVDETKIISIKYWYFQAHGVNPSTV